MRWPKAGVGWCLIAGLAALYLLTYSGTLHSVDEVTQVLARTAELARSGGAHINQVFWTGEAILAGRIGLDGNLYPVHGLVLPLLALPFWLVGLRLPGLGGGEAVLMLSIGLTVVTAWVVYRTGRRLGLADGAALAGGVVFGAGTLAWPYSKYLFAEPLSGLLVAVLFWALAALTTGGGTAWRLLAGGAIGLLVLHKTGNFFLAPAPLAYLTLAPWLERRGGRNRLAIGSRPAWRRVAAGLLPVVVALGLLAAHNVWRWGTPFQSGYILAEGYTASPVAAIWGLLLNSHKGLVWYVPASLIAIGGWIAIGRRRPALAIVTGATAAGYVLLLAQMTVLGPWANWAGGLNWGPRYLVPLMPLVGVGVAGWIAAGPAARWARVATAFVLIAGAAVQVPAALTDHVAIDAALWSRLGDSWRTSLAPLPPGESPLVRQWDAVFAGRFETWWTWPGVGLVWPAGLIGIIAVAAAIGWAALSRRRVIPDRWIGLAGAGLTVLAIGFFAAGRATAESAPYQATGTYPTLRDLGQRLRPADAIVSLDPFSYPIHTYWYKRANPFLGLSPGPPTPEVGRLLDRLVAGADRVWVLAPSDRPLTDGRGRGRLLELIGRRPARLAVDRPDLLRIEPAGSAPPVATFGDRLALLEATASRPSAGDSLMVRSLWRVAGPADPDLTVFVHAIGDPAAPPIAQADGPPLDGVIPPDGWPIGLEIVDERRLSLPAGAPCRVRIGVYRLATGERLRPVGTGDPESRSLEIGCDG